MRVAVHSDSVKACIFELELLSDASSFDDFLGNKFVSIFLLGIFIQVLYTRLEFIVRILAQNITEIILSFNQLVEVVFEFFLIFNSQLCYSGLEITPLTYHGVENIGMILGRHSNFEF